MPYRDHRGLRTPTAASARGKHALRIGAVVILAGCREQGSLPTDVPDRATDADLGVSRRSVVMDPTPTSCGVDCVLVPGDVPGTTTRPLSTGPDRSTAANSVAWPDTLSNATVMLMRVTGVIPRAYVGALSPSFAHLQGKPYKPIDADGAFSGSYCFGEIRTDFRVSGFVEHELRSCTFSNNNNDADNLIAAEKVTVGRLRGSGTILRTGMNQPTWPGWFNCLNGPCVIASQAEQSITLHPWMDRLALTATPAEVFEGDFVSFTPSVSGGMTLIAGSQRWRWVPHKRAIGGQAQSVTDTQTGGCAPGTVTCRVRVYRTGNMYLRANLNPATVSEQAFAKVTVKPLQLVAEPTPGVVARDLSPVTVRVRTIPERVLTSISITLGPGMSSLPKASAFSLANSATAFSASCNARTGTCTLAGGAAPAPLLITAKTAEGVTLTTTAEVQQIPCPTGDPAMDKPIMRAMLKELLRLTTATGKEYAGFIVRNATTGIESMVIDSTNPQNTCYSSLVDGTLVPPNSVLVQMAHTHPNVSGKQATCVNAKYKNFMNKVPSDFDWDFSEIFPERSVVINPKIMASFKLPSAYDSVYKVVDNLGTKRWVRYPKANAIDSAYTEVPRNAQGCTRP